MGVGSLISRKKRYEVEWVNVISVTRGWAGVIFPEKSVNTLLAPKTGLLDVLDTLPL